MRGKRRKYCPEFKAKMAFDAVRWGKAVDLVSSKRQSARESALDIEKELLVNDVMICAVENHSGKDSS
ncbi:hypothetical protein GTP19_17990 [Vibrio cholerae]|nr:hypothetical protein [Vibrio cholerae]